MTVGIDDLLEIKTAYEKLMVRYAGLLRLVASGKVSWLTRQMVEDHIRVKAREVSEAFHLLDWIYAEADTYQESPWIRKEAEYLTRLVGQLANLESFQRWLLSLSWKGLGLLFSAAVLQYSGAADLKPDVNYFLTNFWGIIQSLLLSFGFVLLSLSMVFMAAAAVFTNVKRSYLMQGYDEYGRKAAAPEENEEANLYILENRLFDLLERKKPPEPAWDAWALVVVGVILGSVDLAILVRNAPGAPNPWILWAVGIVFGVMLAAILGREIQARLRRGR